MKRIIKVEKTPSPYSMFLLMLNKTRFDNLLSQPEVKVICDNTFFDREWVKKYNSFFNLPDEDKIPITFPFIATMPFQLKLFSIPEITVNPVGFLHLSNYIRKIKELPLEKPLFSETSLKQTRLVKKGVEITVETTIYSNGEIVWACESKYLKFSKEYKNQEENSEKKGVNLIPIEKPQKETEFSVTIKDAKKYASLSGDFNPIHFSKIFAKIMGLPSPIIHGMWTVGISLKHLSYLQNDSVYFYHVFKGPIPIGSKGKILVQSIDTGEQVEVYIENNPKPCFQGIVSNSEITNNK